MVINVAGDRHPWAVVQPFNMERELPFGIYVGDNENIRLAVDTMMARVEEKKWGASKYPNGYTPATPIAGTNDLVRMSGAEFSKWLKLDKWR